MTRASVKVRPGVLGTLRPAPDQLENAAELLKQHGFKVLRVGRFGVSIEGDSKDFLNELGVALPSAEKGFVGAVAPRDPALADVLETVEIAADPIYFQSNGTP